jgi:two-component system CAI-1 autoinducer sensor kinase/phosphatase CqsS
VQNDVQRATAIVQMLAGNTENVDVRASAFAQVSATECIRQALRRLPFSSDAERRLVKWQEDADFTFLGHQEMIVRSLMGVLKAALQTILRSGGGGIELAVVPGQSANLITIGLPGARVAAQLAAQAFEVQSSLEAGSGTGPGLFFARRTLEAHGGELLLRQDEGGESTFEFRIPKR